MFVLNKVSAYGILRPIQGMFLLQRCPWTWRVQKRTGSQCAVLPPTR